MAEARPGVRRRRTLTSLSLAVAVAVAACTNGDDSSASADAATGGVPPEAASIIDDDAYSAARWSWHVEPIDSSEPVFSRGADLLAGMGSNTKLFSVGTWLDTVGVDHTITTPVHAVGDDLVLVAAGDPVMGSREADAGGELAYSIPPQADANGLPGAEPAPGDPLAGLNDLAEQVAASGVETAGNVTIDDRLWELWDTDGGPISPIVINDNLVAVVTSPTSEGETASFETIPETQAFTIENRTETVAAGGDLTISLDPTATNTEGDPVGTELVLTGTIPADADPTLNVFDVPDPATYARTLFVEALERAGVSVAADPTAENETSGLPDSYGDDTQRASITSPSAQAIATLIWKISFNYAANMTVCYLAVEAGSTDCPDGLATIQERLRDLEINEEDVWILNGAGASFSSTTPQAVVTWIKWLRGLDWGDDLSTMLPVLGVDGSLSLAETDSRSTGRIQAKTGTWAGVDQGNGRLLVPAQALAGLMEDDDGNQYAFGLYSSNGSFPDPAQDIFTSLNNVAAVAAALRQELDT